MRDNPKIAVYMSCYNHEKYVRMAVDSVLQQTYSNLEFFIVNDGSTDDSGRILESYTDERIHYFDFKKNTRFIGASNFLMKVMREQDCDYIACIASDDMWERDKLEKQVSYLRDHPEYKACFTWDRVEYSEDWSGEKYNGQYSHKRNLSRFEWLHNLYWNGNCMNACSMLMEKDVFYEIGGMNENFLIFGDYRAWMLLVQRYPFYLMEEELTIYRRHETNLSNVTADRVIRYYNELYTIYRDLMLPMDRDTFRRAFYPELVYSRCDSEEELLAEKFIVLLSYYRDPCFAQAAMDIYYKNSENEAFVSVLENKYFFDAVAFIDLTGNVGMVYAVNSMMHKEIVPRTEDAVRDCKPGAILLNAIHAQRFHPGVLSDYRYTTLLDLYGRVKNLESGEEEFQKIKHWIDQARDVGMRKTGKNILFVVAGDSMVNLTAFMDELAFDGEDNLAVSIVYKKEQYFTDDPERQYAFPLPEGMRQINLYREEEHCLYFMEELGERADIIYYVDCLGKEYECADMLCGYSLDIQFHCILSAELYEELSRQRAAALSVMGDIHVINTIEE